MSSFYDGNGNNIVIKHEMNADMLDYLTDAFSTAICIGDSVTEGVGSVPDYSKIKNYSYPARLSKMTGWTIENGGKAGLTALQWWQQIFGNYEYSNYQIALIELGLNSGLTDTLDADVVGDDYTQYADTNTGGYCKIIEGVKAQNENIFIVLLISVNMPSSTAGVVKKIGKKYSLPVIDLTDRTYITLSGSEYHPVSAGGNIDNIHLNLMGYLAKAKLIHLGLSEAINNNIANVNTILTTTAGLE